MTSLLGRLLRLFPESVPLEDLFTEAVARLFEYRTDVCLAWLEEIGALSPGRDPETLRVRSQRSFASLDHHDTASRPDLLIEAYSSLEGAGEDASTPDVVMVESKIGSEEGAEQLRRYAEHLGAMSGTAKTLLYVTRSYDPKDEARICRGLEGVRFVQLRWHDFYRFLQQVEEDALIEEVMTFMEEQGMARSYRFSAADLMALSGVPRAFEIFDETLGGEVQAELEGFAGSKVRSQTHGLNNIRRSERYITIAPLHEWDLYCYLGYQMRGTDDYPAAIVFLEARPRALAREASVAAMRRMALHEGWTAYNLDDPTEWAGVVREKALADLLPEEDHIAAVKRFFIESIRQLREELSAFKEEQPDLLWNGG